MSTQLRATVSGSFHRHMSAIYDAVGELRVRGVDVLSPADPRVVDHIGEFLFVASDRLRSIKLVQNRHFEAIRNSDFLWVVCPDGYTGVSTSAEIGAAYMAGVPVYSSSPALDITIGEYVTKVSSIDEALRLHSKARLRTASESILIDPKVTVERSIAILENLGESLSSNQLAPSSKPENILDKTRKHFSQILGSTNNE